jgi:hypothetical protein
VKSAQVVKDQLAKVGIQVNLKPMEMAQYYNKSYSYDYSMSVHTVLTGEEPEEAFAPTTGPTRRTTVGEQGDPSPDRRAGQDPGSEAARRDGPSDPADAAGRRAQRLPLHPIAHYGVQPWVKNYTVPINAYDQRYEEIWLDGKKA